MVHFPQHVHFIKNRNLYKIINFSRNTYNIAPRLFNHRFFYGFQGILHAAFVVFALAEVHFGEVSTA